MPPSVPSKHSTQFGLFALFLILILNWRNLTKENAKMQEKTLSTVTENIRNRTVLWRPSENEVTYWSNRAPFHHMPYHTMTRIGVDALKEVLDPPNCKCPPSNVLLIYIVVERGMVKPNSTTLLEDTYSNKCKCKGALKIGVDSIMHDGTKLLNFKEKFDQFMDKPMLILEILEKYNASLAKYKYIVYGDAFDMALVGDASNLDKDFLKYEADMVVSATEKNVPESLANEGLFEEAMYPWSKYHQHLNAGGFMAKMDEFPFYLKEIIRINKESNQRSDYKKDDQAALKMVHMRHYPKVKVDTMTWIFTKRNYFVDLL